MRVGTTEELADALTLFVREGVDEDENVLVVVDAERAALLRERLDSSDGFRIALSSDVYTSPTRTLAAYIEAVREGTTGGRRMRVAGEPIWAGRSMVELQEWSCVESACNAAFADSMLTMLCPYHVGVLHPEIVSAARRTHPAVRTPEGETSSAGYVDPIVFHQSVRSSRLPPPPPGESTYVELGRDAVRHAGELVDAFATAALVALPRRADLAAAVGEVVSCATASAATELSLRMWTDVHGVTCDVSGRWRVAADYPAFLRTPRESEGFPGLWNAGQSCDLIAVRERAGLTTVRLRVSPAAAGTVAAAESCEAVSELLGVYAIGACEPDEVAEIETHLPGCSQCSDELADLADVVSAMQLAYPAPADRDDHGGDAPAPRERR